MSRPNEPEAHPRPCTLHKSHPTSVAFFDETGAIASDRFFVVGLLRVDDHVALLQKVKDLRRRWKYWEEFKWSGITASNRDTYADLISTLLASSAMFSCFVADRHVADPVARFGNTFAAYEKLATQLLIGSIRPWEIVSVLADNYSAPNSRSFERTVKDECNGRLDRLAVASVVQVDSGATEGLQLVDVLTGAVGFTFRAMAGIASMKSHKGGVSKQLLASCGVPDFNQGLENPEFSVRIYEHKRWLLAEQAKLEGKSPQRRRRRRRRSSRDSTLDV